MEKIQITFIHEIGHHVANELNRNIFDFDRTTKSIMLYPSEIGNFFDGRTISSNSMQNSYHPENSPYEYIRSFYGCFFESLFRKIDIGKCLCGQVTPEDISNNLCKGRADYYQMAEISMRPEINQRFEWWRYLTVDYFNLMKLKETAFKYIFGLNFSDFVLKENNSKYEIDLKLLNKKIETFLIEHRSDFEMAVNQLKLLNDSKLKT